MDVRKDTKYHNQERLLFRKTLSLKRELIKKQKETSDLWLLRPYEHRHERAVEEWEWFIRGNAFECLVKLTESGRFEEALEGIPTTTPDLHRFVRDLGWSYGRARIFERNERYEHALCYALLPHGWNSEACARLAYDLISDLIKKKQKLGDWLEVLQMYNVRL